MSLVAIAGQTFRLRVELESQAAAGTFKSSPTVASGDVKILALPASPAGTETFANSTNAPTALNGPTAEVIIAAAETTAAGNGGELVVVWADAAGDEWYSLSVHIQVKAADVAVAGDEMDLVDAPNATALAAVVAAIDADPPSVNVTMQAGVAVAAADANGNVPVDVKLWKGSAPSDLGANSYVRVDVLAWDASPVDERYPYVTPVDSSDGVNIIDYLYIRDAMKLAPSGGAAEVGSVDAHLDALALEATAQAVLLDTGTTLPALIGGLSGATVTVVSSVDGGTVTVYAADTWRFTVASDQLALADYETLGLIVKRSARQADTQALLYLRTDTGLVRMDGAAPVSAGNGTLTKTATSFTAVVHVAETQGLAPGGYRWWLKGLDTTPAPDEAVTLATGEFVVLAAGLQAVV